MLIVGRVGWGENLHASRLTPYEQYTHISLWCLLSAPLLIGCDMGNLDDFTLNLLKNRHVIAIDQDALGVQADKIIDKEGFQVWVKPMADGSKAIGIFNLNNSYANYTLNFKDIAPGKVTNVREVWTQKRLKYPGNKISCHIPPHGVKLIQVFN
jgi:alpha-galactosidase